MKHRKLLTMLAIVSSLALVASACSNDDDGGGGTGETGATGSGEVDCTTVEFGCVEVASGEPISIGTLQSISGDTRNLGLDQQYGVELAADYLDGTFDGTNGQIAGHDIDFVHEDDGCSAEGGQAGAQILAANPQVVAVIGTSCSSASLGIADKILAGEKGILTDVVVGDEPRVDDSRNPRARLLPNRAQRPDPGRGRVPLRGGGAGRDDRRHHPRREPVHPGSHRRLLG